MITKALKYAFPKTIPILTGFLFLGFSYGVYMSVYGFPFYYPLIMSMVIFGGSLEFVAVEMLLSPFAPLQVFVMALLIQARHLFYGLSMLEKYKGTGLKKFFLIFGLCDETFSINVTSEVPSDIDKGLYYLCVTLLNQSYWITGATLGGLIGSILNFNTEGIGFVMTSMFVVIFIEQWQKDKTHIASYIGLMVSVICLIIFGADTFMLPTMCGILLLLTILRKPIEAKEAL